MRGILLWYTLLSVALRLGLWCTLLWHIVSALLSITLRLGLLRYTLLWHIVSALLSITLWLGLLRYTLLRHIVSALLSITLRLGLLWYTLLWRILLAAIVLRRLLACTLLGGVLAFSKLLFLNYYLCGINLLAITIGVAACLNAS